MRSFMDMLAVTGTELPEDRNRISAGTVAFYPRT